VVNTDQAWRKRKAARALRDYTDALAGRPRRPTFGDRVKAFAASVLAYAVLVWVAMLAMGAAHSFDHRVPAFGLVTVAWIGVALRSLAPGNHRV
jgi:hypothetical protein